MNCKKCGAEIQDGAKFCAECGAEVKNEKLPTDEIKGGKKVTENIFLCPDGKYRWVYELSMLKNPVILLTVVKVLLIAGAIVAAFVAVLNLINGNPVFSQPGDMEKKGLIVTACVIVFCIIIAYLVVAGSKGFKYCVLFEMDEKGIVHKELPESFKKTQVLSVLAFAAGLAAKNPGAAGANLLAASRNSLTSTFSKVKSVKVLRRYHTIKLNEPFAKNQVYAENEDFDFVLEYISARVSDKAAK